MPRGKMYTKDFRDEAVRLSQTSGKKVAEVARELGVNPQTLHEWRRQAISKRQLPVPEGESLEQKVKRLEMELRLVTEERDIIKKAIAYFAQPPRK